jgi:hypothetical protein
LDEKVRSIIEREFDNLMKSNIVPSIRWFTQEVPHSSVRDIALGYVMGSIESYGRTVHELVMREPIERDELESIIRRRLAETREKINRELHR